MQTTGSMLGGLGKDMKRIARETSEFLRNDLPTIVAVEGIAQVKENFRNEGFEDRGITKWEPRKTRDKRGRDITTYRTNRVGRAGSPNAYGRKIKGRKILTGHNTAGNKLQNSIRARKSPTHVAYVSHKAYAKIHNEGDGNMPQRQYIGWSHAWDVRVERKIKKGLDKIYK